MKLGTCGSGILFANKYMDRSCSLFPLSIVTICGHIEFSTFFRFCVVPKRFVFISNKIKNSLYDDHDVECIATNVVSSVLCYPG